MEERPAYYSILTAEVRYDPELKANEKLLYSEITALTYKEGYCWATNNYFSELYGVSIQTVSEWINHLKKRGYITVEMEREGRMISRRKIGLRENPKGYSGKPEDGYSGFDEEGIREKPKENNTRENITSKNNKKEYTGRFIPPTLEDVENYVREKGLSVKPSDFYNYFTEGNWIDSKGNKVKSWKQKLLTWENMRKPAEKKQIGEVL